MIYADNCATTKLHPEVLEAMMPYLKDQYGNPSQSYRFGKKSLSAIKEARATIAKCICAHEDEIYFTSGGSEGDNWIVKKSRGPVYTSKIEHHAVLNACRDEEKTGRKVNYLDVDKNGVVILPEAINREESGILFVMFANNETGVIQPVGSLSEYAHNSGILFATDAVQAVGHTDIDVKRMGIDYLAASAHKFNGPKGIGFVYMKGGYELEPLIAGGGQESGRRAGTENVAAITGMAKALLLNTRLIKEREEKLVTLTDIIKNTLLKAGVDHIINTPKDSLPGVLSLSIAGIEGEMLLHRLDLMDICISTGSACDSKNTQVSHVIRAIALPDKYAKGTIRISFDMDNTLDEARTIADSIVKIYDSHKKKMGEVV